MPPFANNPSYTLSRYPNLKETNEMPPIQGPELDI